MNTCCVSWNPLDFLFSDFLPWVWRFWRSVITASQCKVRTFFTFLQCLNTEASDISELQSEMCYPSFTHPLQVNVRLWAAPDFSICHRGSNISRRRTEKGSVRFVFPFPPLKSRHMQFVYCNWLLSSWTIIVHTHCSVYLNLTSFHFCYFS